MGSPPSWDLDQLATAIDAVGDVDLAALTPCERGRFVAALEAQRARLDAAQVVVLDTVDRRGLHHADGMRTARVHAGYHARLSPAEAARRWKLTQALRDLDLVRAAFEAGQIGTCQARRFARTWSNDRVREQLIAAQEALVAIAAAEQYPWFDRTMSEWERRADPDGTIDADAGTQRASLVRLFDGTWELSGRFSSSTGAILDQILSHYVAAELAADWAVARDEHGDTATEAHLPRTAAQRRADALVAIFLDAVSTPPGGRDPKLVLNLLMSWDEYQRELHRLAHHPTGDPADQPPDPTPHPDIDTDTDSGSTEGDSRSRADQEPSAPAAGRDPVDDPGTGPVIDLREGAPPPAHDPGTEDHDQRRADAGQEPPRPLGGPLAGPVPRCGALDGTWLDPWDTVKLSVGAHLRRVVIGADSTVIDLGRTARFFTGSARDAIMLTSPRCVWAGCDTPTSRCEADHLTEHHRGGSTDPTNGAPLCGHHNRLENHRFRVWRDPAGTWHTVRPDGTEI